MPIRNRRRAAIGLLGLCGFTTVLAQQLPPPPVPPQNPLTEPKRLLGKILFWDEQLSSDNTVACGTCHILSRAGSDPRFARNPGLDSLFNSPDDKFGSFGVAHMDANGEYINDPVFGASEQVTRRSAQSIVSSAYSNNAMFWDGRATGQFTDPETGAVLIPNGGALESQAIAPIMSTVEMGNDGRTWQQVRSKLQSAAPLALATQLPPDIAAAIAANPTYPALFQAAFGDPAITAARIGMALATYQRTLIPNQSLWDRFVAGDPTAMTPAQQRGFNVFNNPASRCNICHTPPVFSNQTFRNIGVRPVNDDTGRQEVTGDPADRGRFKVPTLRNVGLRTRFMHTGQFTNLAAVIGFYDADAAHFPDNLDPLILPIAIPPPARADLADFLQNALTDPRVANQQPPFDRPRLASENRPTDLNDDGLVNLNDLTLLLAAFGACAGDANFNALADFDGDGCIGLADLTTFLSDFGQ